MISNNDVELKEKKDEVEEAEVESAKDLSESGAAFLESSTVKWWPTLLLFPPLIPFFVKFKVKFDEEHLRFGFLGWPFRKTVNLNEIVFHEVIEIKKPLLETGLGIHFGRQGDWCYVFKAGKAIRIRLKSGGAYLFNCEEAEKLDQLLQKHKNVE